MNKLIGLLVLLTFSFSALASDRGTVKFHSLTDDFTEKTTEFVKISGMEGKLDIVVMCSNQGSNIFMLQVSENTNFRFNRTSTVDIRDPDRLIAESSDLRYLDESQAFFWGVRSMSTPTADFILDISMITAEVNAAKEENEWSYHIMLRARSGSNTETDSFKVFGYRDAMKELNCSQYKSSYLLQLI